MKEAAVAVTVIAMAMGLTMRPSLGASWPFWAGLVLPYAALSAWSLRNLRRAGLLGERLRPRSGDISIGILLGLLMVVGGVVVQRWVAPMSSPRGEWLATLYLQVGNVQASGVLISLLAFLALMEELVWRGLVLEGLSSRFGTRWAPPASALAYSLAHLPTVLTLQSGQAGPNPLLVIASLGCGVIWGFAVKFLGRLWPVIIAHVVVSYFLSSPLPSWLGLG